MTFSLMIFVFTKFPGLREYLTLFNFSQVLYLDYFISYRLNAMQKKKMYVVKSIHIVRSIGNTLQ